MNRIFFVSIRTGKVLQSNPNGNVRCENTNRLWWEAWTIVELESSGGLTTTAGVNRQIHVGSEHRALIRAMTQLGKRPDEIRAFVAILYPQTVALVATAVKQSGQSELEHLSAAEIESSTA